MRVDRFQTDFWFSDVQAVFVLFAKADDAQMSGGTGSGARKGIVSGLL